MALDVRTAVTKYFTESGIAVPPKTQARTGMQTKDEKIQSAHPALQAMLPRLAQLGGREWRPVFQGRDEAEKFIENYARREVGPELQLHGVWAIDHADLTNSRLHAWSVVEYIN